MTRDDIICMAREAGGSRVLNAMVFDCDEMLERFAALVAAHERDRIIAANAPEIERINAYIKALKETRTK